MRWVSIVALAVVLLAPIQSATQRESQLVGRRVRVRAPALSIKDDNATLMRWSDDSITLSVRAPIVTAAAGGIPLDPATLWAPISAKVWAPDFGLDGTKVELWVCEPGVLQVRSNKVSLEMPLSAVTRIQVLDDAGRLVTMPLAAVESIAVYEDRKSAVALGAATGFTLGAIGGVMAVDALGCMMSSCVPVAAGEYVRGALVGGLVGAFLGTFIAAPFGWDSWQEIPAETFRVAPVARGTEFGFVASVSF
jgi:hypothetical protein